MNTQAAIEAAKIAAETAARNAWITTIVTVIALLITSGISIWSVMRNSKIAKELGEKNLKSLEQKRYIDAISAERVKWINTMRDRFSEYFKYAHIQMPDLYTLQKAPGKVDEEQMRERGLKLIYITNQIQFLLNTSEPVSKIIGQLQQRTNRSLRLISASHFDYDKVETEANDLAFFYQVILKAEWKRVKEENKKGEEIDGKTMNSIYKETAEKLNKRKYEKYFDQLKS
ncbi:hypothetical protein CN290_28570 [Bacillus cereus]|uniref:DUF4760 domain-containing protein n=1 Tax=Bacillus cereus TaxID=1396 RepID=A0A2A8XVE7_BACCE|nr:hypothetical protein [Bacillus cereus]PFC69933.1 hypothetical protein CN290_28570 [Bacillus cereus]PFR16500.1 hypothetical protein COK23_25375 [Bacillus cereus]